MAMGSRVLYSIIFIVSQLSLIGIAHGEVFLPFDYFQLSLSWPAAVCNKASRAFCKSSSYPLPQYFTIHGLWPLKVNSATPIDCYAPDHTYQSIWDSNLLYYLNAYWPNIIGGPEDNQGGWGYQWNKHGRCALTWFPQLQYFQLAIHLASQLNIVEQFRLNNIYPGLSYRPQDIQLVVESLVQQHVVLWCTTNKEGILQLEIIHFCYGLNFAMIPCPDYYRPSCTSNAVLFTNVSL